MPFVLSLLALLMASTAAAEGIDACGAIDVLQVGSSHWDESGEGVCRVHVQAVMGNGTPVSVQLEGEGVGAAWSFRILRLSEAGACARTVGELGDWSLAVLNGPEGETVPPAGRYPSWVGKCLAAACGHREAHAPVAAPATAGGAVAQGAVAAGR